MIGTIIAVIGALFITLWSYLNSKRTNKPDDSIERTFFDYDGDDLD